VQEEQVEQEMSNHLTHTVVLEAQRPLGVFCAVLEDKEVVEEVLDHRDQQEEEMGEAQQSSAPRHQMQQDYPYRTMTVPILCQVLVNMVVDQVEEETAQA